MYSFSWNCAGRRILYVNVTADPSADWTQQQLRESLPGDHPFRFLIHDRDSIFSQQLDQSVPDRPAEPRIDGWSPVSQFTLLELAIAGTGAAGFSGDGGNSLHAKLNSPEGAAVDAFGNLYVADSGDNRIRKVVLNAESVAPTVSPVVNGTTNAPGVMESTGFSRWSLN